MNFLRRIYDRPENKGVVDFVDMGDHAIVSIKRGRVVASSFKQGPNEVSAIIVHADGSFENLGISHNLLTTVGRDLAAAAIGGAAGVGGALTASSGTSATPSGGGLTTDQYKGWRVYCPVTGVTTAPVYGNIGSNSTTVLTVDQWWTPADGVGTTPASTNGYIILPAGIPRFMGITTDSAIAAAGDTTLATEITGSNCARALATYAHSGGAATFTLQKAFAPNATLTAVHKMGLFTALNTTAAGVLYFESVLNADATVVSGDTLTITDTVTLS